MEIYSGAVDSVVTLDLPAGVVSTARSVDIVAYENGRDIYTFDTVTVTESGGFAVTIPWHLTRHDRELFIDWTVTYNPGTGPVVVKDRTYVQVITPVLPLTEVASIAELDLTTQRDEVVDLERRVRYAISAFTGQNFGRFFGVMRVSGNGGSKLMLPAPLLEYRGFAYDGIYRPNYAVKVINNGWALASGGIYIDSIKQAPPEWMLDRFDYTGKISAPMLYGHHTFRDGVEYAVEGLWGYYEVPGDVKQAARLLVSDYSCDESLWRDRYIDQIRAGDWQMNFNPQAFTGTGNVQADQILSGYRRATMVVV